MTNKNYGQLYIALVQGQIKDDITNIALFNGSSNEYVSLSETSSSFIRSSVIQPYSFIRFRRTVVTKAPLRVQFLTTLGGRGWKKKLQLY